MGVSSVVTIPISFAEPPPFKGVPNLERVVQDQNNWCWAACTVMIVKRFDTASTIQQCEVVTKKANLDNQSSQVDCCAGPALRPCSKSCEVDKISMVHKEWNINSQQVDFPSIGVDGLLQLIRDEISSQPQSRPVEVCYQIDSVGSHVVLVSGFCEDTDGAFRYTVTDPFIDEGLLSRDKMATLDDRGKLMTAWIGIQPGKNP